ncbi:MAG: hypothetical protein KJ052_09085 [Candidatus Hydrogenedentes bacterium]|nr:hypothetical protein [Candidatus Hydrogenedentota bacterium]
MELGGAVYERDEFELELGDVLYDCELPREGVPMDGAGLLLGTLTDGREGTDGAGA